MGGPAGRNLSRPGRKSERCDERDHRNGPRRSGRRGYWCGGRQSGSWRRCGRGWGTPVRIRRRRERRRIFGLRRPAALRRRLPAVYVRKGQPDPGRHTQFGIPRRHSGRVPVSSAAATKRRVLYGSAAWLWVAFRFAAWVRVAFGSAAGLCVASGSATTASSTSLIPEGMTPSADPAGTILRGGFAAIAPRTPRPRST